MRRALRSSWLLIACACSSEPSSPATQQVVAVPSDAAVPKTQPAEPEEPAFARTPKRQGRPIEIILRSTPSGARVAVDGVEIGVTPTMWLGETGAPHEFTFVLAGHALARYRFVPVASGLVHPRLEPVAEPANVPRPPPQMISPQPAPPSVMQPEPSLSAPTPEPPTVPLHQPAPAPTPPAPTPPAAEPAPTGSGN